MPEFDNRWAFQDEQLRLLIGEMEREMSTGWAMGSLYGDSLSTAFVIALIEKKCGEAVQDALQLKGGLCPGRLRRVLSYIHENLQRDIRLGELANIAGLSHYHFARSFRQTTGATPHQYLSQIRINRAKSLLLRRHWTVLQVAGAVGFADGSRFSKVFQASTGVVHENGAETHRHAVHGLQDRDWADLASDSAAGRQGAKAARLLVGLPTIVAPARKPTPSPFQRPRGT